MGSIQFVSSSGGGGGGGSKNGNYSSVGKNGNSTSNEKCGLSSTFAFCLFSFVVLGSIGSLYGRFMLAANVRTGITALGCEEDNEGSWAIGIYYGDSPFSLKPIEAVGSFFFFLLFFFLFNFQEFFAYVHVIDFERNFWFLALDVD